MAILDVTALPDAVYLDLLPDHGWAWRSLAHVSPAQLLVTKEEAALYVTPQEVDEYHWERPVKNMILNGFDCCGVSWSAFSRIVKRLGLSQFHAALTPLADTTVYEYNTIHNAAYNPPENFPIERIASSNHLYINKLQERRLSLSLDISSHRLRDTELLFLSAAVIPHNALDYEYENLLAVYEVLSLEDIIGLFLDGMSLGMIRVSIEHGLDAELIRALFTGE